MHDHGNLAILFFSIEMSHEGFRDQGMVIFATLGKSIGLDLKVGFDAL